MKRAVYFGNPWIGMFMVSNEKNTILPLDVPAKLEQAVIEELKTEVIKTGIADSNLLGVYIVMNSHGIILPNIANDAEIEILKKNGMNIYKSNDRYNANGNNIAVNDNGGIINENISHEERVKIADVLGVELVPMKIAGYSTVGSCVRTNNTGFLVHYAADEQMIKELERVFRVKGAEGSVNTGTGFVSYGIVANRNGYVAGEATTAYELGRVEEALGFIK